MAIASRLSSAKHFNKTMSQTTTRQLTAGEWPEIKAGEFDQLMTELGVMNPELFHVEIQFIDQAAIQALNTEHRQKDEPTDILSFPLFSHTELQDLTSNTQNLEPILLGSLAVCPEIIAERPHGMSWTLLHGLRHLFGYDHDDTGEHWSPSKN